MEGGERVQALDAPVGLVRRAADAGDPRAVAPLVLGVDLVYGFGPDLLLRPADARAGLDARDRRVEARAGNPERRRHLAPRLVLYYARPPDWATGGDPERRRLAPKLTRHDPVVVGVS